MVFPPALSYKLALKTILTCKVKIQQEMTTSVYKIDEDFGGVAPLEHQLWEEIEAAPLISRLVQNIRRKGNNIYIDFNIPIGIQKAYLDAIIALHRRDVLPRMTISSITERSESRNVSYTRVLTWVYNGSRTDGAIVSVDCVAYMENGPSSYSIQMYDRKNREIVAEGTFTNTDEDTVALTVYPNKVPTKKTRMEISIKRDSNPSKYVYITGVTFGLK